MQWTLNQVMKATRQSREIIMNIRKSKLFHREKMQPLKAKDYVKVIIIVGIIVIPLVIGLFV